MEIYYNKHEYIAALIGGVLIGISATLNLLLYGKITGLSGIFSGIIYPQNGDVSWRFNFLVGLITLPFAMFTVFGRAIQFTDFSLIIFDDDAAVAKSGHILCFVIAGLLVGFGTKLGNGCTSGHGVCGLPRFSLRSIVAVCVFMFFGFLVATLRYHCEHLKNGEYWGQDWSHLSFYFWCGLLVCVVLTLVFERKHFKLLLTQFLLGCLFGKGLVVSGMCRQSKVLGFLTIKDGWDPSLAFVMGGAVLVNAITFYYIIYVRKIPVWADSFAIPKKKELEASMIIGNALFGIGWGFSGFCPGPGLVDFFNTSVLIVFIVFMTVGQYLAIAVQKIIDSRGKAKRDSNSSNDNIELTKHYS